MADFSSLFCSCASVCAISNNASRVLILVLKTWMFSFIELSVFFLSFVDCLSCCVFFISMLLQLKAERALALSQ